MKLWKQALIGVATVGITATTAYMGYKWYKSIQAKKKQAELDAMAKVIADGRVQRPQPAGLEDMIKKLDAEGYKEVDGKAVKK